MLRVMAATALFGLAHSALASRAAKRMAAELVGGRNRNGLYRLFYLGQSVVTFAVLAGYIRRQPGLKLYHVHGSLAWLLRGSQVVTLGYATWAARQVGIRPMLGQESFEAWQHG